MKYLLILSVLIVGCAHKPLEERRERILDCTKDLIEYDSLPGEAYMICRDLHTQARPQPQYIEVPDAE